MFICATSACPKPESKNFLRNLPGLFLNCIVQNAVFWSCKTCPAIKRRGISPPTPLAKSGSLIFSYIGNVS